MRIASAPCRSAAFIMVLLGAVASGAVAGGERFAPAGSMILAQAPAIQDPLERPRPVPGLSYPRTALEFGGSYEKLTNDLPDWSSVYLEAIRDFKPRHTLYGGLRETRRFDLNDTEAYGGLYYPLADAWTGLIEGNLSPTHNVLAKYSALVQLFRSFPGGWVAGLGLRHTEYTASTVNMAVFTAERYWSSLRAAYTFYSSRLEDAGSTPAHRFQLDHYYGERSSVGLSYTTGRESESVGPPVGIITTDVRDWTLYGRHWFAPKWALTYDLLTHEQGDFYRRRGLRLGIRYSF